LINVSAQKTITVAITGASGFRYGLRLIECLLQANHRLYCLVSEAARAVAVHEENLVIPGQTSILAEFLQQRFNVNADQLHVYGAHEWTAPIASGSAKVDAMIVCPCSSGTLAAIANGLSNNLIERAADVMLKEQRQLILVPREMPLSAIQLENMLKLARLNTLIMPASPGFYHQPKAIEDLIDFVVARILNALGIEQNLVPPWGGLTQKTD
jgi:4-hydroxy-3-polyprenylbenzoate decarboxylase